MDPGTNRDENSPLLGPGASDNAQTHLATLQAASGDSGMAFRRSRSRRKSVPTGDRRMSVRGYIADHQELVISPLDALAPLVAGGVIVGTDGYKTEPRAASTVKVSCRRLNGYDCLYSHVHTLTPFCLSNTTIRRFLRLHPFDVWRGTAVSTFGGSTNSVTGGNPVVCCVVWRAFLHWPSRSITWTR